MSTGDDSKKITEMPYLRHFRLKLEERETGIEPAAPTLARWCSTAEPLAHTIYNKNDNTLPWYVCQQKIRKKNKLLLYD